MRTFLAIVLSLGQTEQSSPSRNITPERIRLDRRIEPLQIVFQEPIRLTQAEVPKKIQPEFPLEMLPRLRGLLDKVRKDETLESINRKIQAARENMEVKFVPSPHDEFAIIKMDLLLHVPPDQRPFTRYMTSGFLPNRKVEVDLVDFLYSPTTNRQTGLLPDERNPYVAKTEKQEITRWQLANRVASFGLNSISQHGEVIPPEIVDGTDGRIIRFQLDSYNIRLETWEWFIKNEDYFRHITDEETYRLCGTYRPLIRTDWFLANAFVEPVYSSLLFSQRKEGVPKTNEEIHSYFRFNVADVKTLERDYVAAVNGEASFVANYSRRLNRYEGILDYLHISDDFKNNVDFVKEEVSGKGKVNTYVIKDPIENLLDPSYPQFKSRNTPQPQKVTYQPDAHEGIYQLPNRLQGYYITDSTGNLVPEADPKIVRDTRNSYEPVVFNGKSCMWCHDRGMNIPVNTAQQHLGKRLDPRAYDTETIRLLKRLYDTEYGSRLLSDSQTFCFAVAQCNKLDAGFNGQAFREFVQEYDYQQLTAAQCAAELGVSVAELQQAVQKSTSFRLMTLFGNPPTPIPRQVWEKQFQVVVALLKLPTVPHDLTPQ